MLVAKKELDYYYPDQVDIQEEKSRKVRKKKKSKSKVVYKLLVMGFAIIGLVLSLFILYRYANITKVRLEITELEKQKIELEREKEDLIAQLEGIKSSSKIEEDAIVRLGMDYPTEGQIVYMEVNDLALEGDLNKTDEFVIVKQLKNIVNLVLSLF